MCCAAASGKVIIDMVPIVMQRHGDLVHVPAGYMHQVENPEGCAKMVWDKYVVAQFDCYAVSLT